MDGLNTNFMFFPSSWMKATSLFCGYWPSQPTFDGVLVLVKKIVGVVG